MQYFESNRLKDFINNWYNSLIILPVCIYFTINIGEYFFIDNLNLLIHEGGHGIFSIFGGFIYTLGGTLMQIIIPSLVILYAVTNFKRNILQWAIVWLGQNFFNIARYASDARDKIIPLIGGKNVYHDWEWMLKRLDLLEYDKQIGYTFYGIGILIFIIAILIPAFVNKYSD